MVIRYHEDRAASRYDYISKIFIGRLVHSKSLEKLEILENAVIGVQPDGTIAFVHESNQSADVIREQYSADVVQLQPTQFLFPGMVDTHLHASRMSIASNLRQCGRTLYQSQMMIASRLTFRQNGPIWLWAWREPCGIGWRIGLILLR